MVKEWHKYTLNPTTKSPFALPDLPGSVREMRDPVLQFNIFLVEVLRLYKPCENDTRILRRDLLRSLNVKEFDARGEYVNPSASIILRHVMCFYCSNVEDLNLTSNRGATLACGVCKSDYDAFEVQSQLLGELAGNVYYWQQQDLKCTVCTRVASLNLIEPFPTLH